MIINGKGCSLRERNRGFTLVELIVGMTLSLIVGSILVPMLVSALGVFRKVTIENQQHMLVEYIEEKLKQEISLTRQIAITDKQLRGSEIYEIVYNSIELRDGKLIKKDEINKESYVIDANILGKHKLSGEFSAQEAGNLKFDLIIDEGSEYEMFYPINIKLLNVSLSPTYVRGYGIGIEPYEGMIVVDTNASKNKFIYVIGDATKRSNNFKE